MITAVLCVRIVGTVCVYAKQRLPLHVDVRDYSSSCQE